MAFVQEQRSGEGAAREENKAVMLAQRRWKLGMGVVEGVLFSFLFPTAF